MFIFIMRQSAISKSESWFNLTFPQNTPYPPAPGPGFMPQPGPPNSGYPYPPGNGGGYPPPNPGYPPPNAFDQGYPPPNAYDQGYPPAGFNQPSYPPPQQVVITQPPGMGDWMQLPQGGPTIPNCPPGLEYLTTIDELFVKQKVELLEAFIGFETNNKFTIKNSMGQKIFWASEDTDCCTRNCCGSMRPMDIKIMDANKHEVIHLNRPLRCDSCWCPCFLQEMEVTAPPGNFIGKIEQNWSILSPSFDIKDATGETVLKIEGPCCTFSICGDVEFQLMTTNGHNVGKISKKWSGFGRELFTDADFFGISFPIDLDVRMKAVMLGACFLIVSFLLFIFFYNSKPRLQK